MLSTDLLDFTLDSDWEDADSGAGFLCVANSEVSTP